MKIDCHIVKDLLPSYVDHMTSRQTTQDIQTHLEECGDCRRIYEDMQYDLKLENESANDIHLENRTQLDFLKKIKLRYFYRYIVGMTLLFIIFLRCILFYTNVIGSIYLYELFAYVPLCAALLFYVFGHTFHSYEKAGSCLVVCHTVLAILSILSMGGTYCIFRAPDLRFISSLWHIQPYQAAHLFVLFFHTILFLSLGFVFYGLLASVKKTKAYFSVSCHGLGTVAMLFVQLCLITRLDLPAAYLPEIMLFYLLYGEGAIIAILSIPLLKQLEKKQLVI